MGLLHVLCKYTLVNSFYVDHDAFNIHYLFLTVFLCAFKRESRLFQLNALLSALRIQQILNIFPCLYELHRL
jgi:hypothetical protein